MIEVVSTMPMAWWGEMKTYYDVLVDGESVARYPSREEAEADAEQRRKDQGDDTPNSTNAP